MQMECFSDGLKGPNLADANDNGKPQRPYFI